MYWATRKLETTSSHRVSAGALGQVAVSAAGDVVQNRRSVCSVGTRAGF